SGPGPAWTARPRGWRRRPRHCGTNCCPAGAGRSPELVDAAVGIAGARRAPTWSHSEAPAFFPTASSDFCCGLQYVVFGTCWACPELANSGGGHSRPVTLDRTLLWLFLTTTTPSWRRCVSAGTSPRDGAGTRGGHRYPGVNCPLGLVTRCRCEESARLTNCALRPRRGSGAWPASLRVMPAVAA